MSSEVLVSVAGLEALLPEKRILDRKNLWNFYHLLFRLWEQMEGPLLSADRLNLFRLKDYFHDYILHQAGPYHPTKEEVLERLNALLPSKE